MFLVELHLDVVLEVLLVVRFEFVSDKFGEKKKTKEDLLKKLGRLIYKWRR